MISSPREYWIAFGNWCVVIWLTIPQILSRATRGSKMMFFIYLLEPLIIICVFYTVRAFLKQATPNYGTSLFLFYATGFLPYYLFMRVSSRTRAADTNPYSFMPGANALDVYVATAILEALLNIATTIMVLYVLWGTGIDDARPYSLVDCAIPTLILFLLGMGVGMINNVINGFLPFWYIAYRISTRGLIFLSGVIFIVDLSPPWLRDIMIVNPLSHAIEWYRLGIYGRYPHNSLDESYLLTFTLITLCVGFVLDRAVLRIDRR